MTSRKAYAKNSDGTMALMFKSRQLRDFFIENVKGYEKATCSEYRMAERKENERDAWGNEINLKYSAIDMNIAEYWDGEWEATYDAASHVGLL